ILRRDAGGGAQPIVNGVHALALTYFDAADAPTAAPAEDLSVEIVLVTRPDYSVPGSTVSTVLTTRVRLRNRLLAHYWALLHISGAASWRRGRGRCLYFHTLAG